MSKATKEKAAPYGEQLSVEIVCPAFVCQITLCIRPRSKIFKVKVQWSVAVDDVKL